MDDPLRHDRHLRHRPLCFPSRHRQPPGDLDCFPGPTSGRLLLLLLISTLQHDAGMMITLSSSREGFILALPPAILELICIDPTKPIQLTTDGHRLILSQGGQPTDTEPSAPPPDTPPFTRRGSCLDACATFLAEIRTAAKPREIWAGITRRGLWSSTGKTPDQTVSALIASDIKRFGNRSRFIRVAPNTYTINPQHAGNTL